MFEPVARTAVTMTFLVLASMPASAQFQVRVDVPLPALEIRVGERAPPPRLHESRPDRPDRHHVWLQGSWHWQGQDWAWLPGRWDRPSYSNARWVKARYVRVGHSWRYEPAHWSNQRLQQGEDYRRWKYERYNNGHHYNDQGPSQHPR